MRKKILGPKKPSDRCSKHKRSATIWYRDTGELICFKCNTVIIKGVKRK